MYRVGYRFETQTGHGFVQNGNASKFIALMNKLLPVPKIGFFFDNPSKVCYFSANGWRKIGKQLKQVADENGYTYVLVKKKCLKNKMVVMDEHQFLY